MLNLNTKSKIANRGFISMLVALVAILLLLSAFKVNIRGYIDSSSERALDSNVVLIRETVKFIWQDYIRQPIFFVWGTYVSPFVNGDFLGGLKDKIRERSAIPND